MPSHQPFISICLPSHTIYPSTSQISQVPCPLYHPLSMRYPRGIKTLRTEDTSDLRHFGIGAEMSVRHFSRIGLAWRLCSRRNRFNAFYLKHDGTAIDCADRTASASQSHSRRRQRMPATYSSQYSLRRLCNAAKDLRCSRIAWPSGSRRTLSCTSAASDVCRFGDTLATRYSVAL